MLRSRVFVPVLGEKATMSEPMNKSASSKYLTFALAHEESGVPVL